MGKEYAALNTKEARATAIANAETVSELDAMWAAWEARGMSRQGLTYAAILDRKAALGHELDETELAAVKRAAVAAKRGAELAPITGTLEG
jgi:hypothetical protein